MSKSYSKIIKLNKNSFVVGRRFDKKKVFFFFYIVDVNFSKEQPQYIFLVLKFLRVTGESTPLNFALGINNPCT